MDSFTFDWRFQVAEEEDQKKEQFLRVLREEPIMIMEWTLSGHIEISEMDKFSQVLLVAISVHGGPPQYSSCNNRRAHIPHPQDPDHQI